MPTTAPRALALTFDPMYVSLALEVWRERVISSIRRSDFESLTTEHAESYFEARTAMGCHEETVSPTKISRALTLLKSLQLVKQMAIGPRDARETWIEATPNGEAVLQEQPTAGGLRPLLAEAIVAQSPDLRLVLRAVQEGGPFTQPVLQFQPGAPRRGATYSQAVADGIATYQARYDGSRSGHGGLPETRRPSAAQLLKSAQTAAGQHHPAGKARSLEALVSLATGLGLLWTDNNQVNSVISARQIGLAARERQQSYSPTVPNWKVNREKYVEALTVAHMERSDSTGFAPIGALRGAMGRTLALSPAAVDYVLVSARDAGDRGEIPISLHFEPNEDLLYSPQRDPLIWRDHAYDFVEAREAPSNLKPYAQRVANSR
jgi:hypothetical protein